MTDEKREHWAGMAIRPICGTCRRDWEDLECSASCENPEKVWPTAIVFPSEEARDAALRDLDTMAIWRGEKEPPPCNHLFSQAFNGTPGNEETCLRCQYRKQSSSLGDVLK